ncbi:MAG TPA: helix-turn-helix transcriptional regulator [Candidatus Coproplasma excrementipullorum]|nr:helix-turn-helix transcriptional regulator [Candidatus Coproplasma excrementipullorum]
MNSSLLRSARIAKQMTQSDIAAAIEKTTDCYSKKERGQNCFTPDEIVIIANVLGLTFRQINDIFFDSKLPISNNGA